MILLTEIIILLTFIGSKKVEYLEKIINSDKHIYNTYFSCIEKYILVESENIKHSKNIQIEQNSDNNYCKVDKDKKLLIQLLKEQELKINEFTIKIKELLKEKKDFENNLKEKEKIVQKKHNLEKKVTGELISNNILLNQLRIDNKEKDKIIDSLKSQFNLIQKKEEKLINNKNNHKKRNYYKNNLEEQKENDNLANNIQLINNKDELLQKNEYLIKENDLLKNEINKINKNLLIDKEKIKHLEIENKNLIYEKNELNEKLLKKKITTKDEKIYNKNKSLDKIMEEDYEKQIKYNNIKIDEILLENENLKLKISLINKENQKLFLDLEKSELENQKLLFAFDCIKNKSKKYLNNNKNTNEIINEINKDKINDLDKLKKDDKIKIIERMLIEKKELIKNYENLEKKLMILKNNNSLNSNKNNMENYNNCRKEKKMTSNYENFGIKNEIENLNTLLFQNDEEIKKLKDERQSTDDDINIKMADLDFYKKLYEEQKLRVNKEHELISNSLYKLAVHFMSLKDDLQKKIKNK